MGMGYQGFVRFYKTGPSTDALLLLATGASVNQVLEPIMSAAVWGAGWYNAPTSAHYADAAIHYEGSVDFEMQASDDVWDFIGNFAINQRAYPRSLEISPDGARVYRYLTSSTYGANYDTSGAWCSELSMNTSENSFVTASLGVWALYRDVVDPGGTGAHNFDNYSYIKQKKGIVGGDPTVFAASNPLNPNGANVDPIPFWKTNAKLLMGTYAAPFTGGALPQSDLQTIEWNVSVSNNVVPLYACSGGRLPIAILQGPIDGTGSLVLYHPTGVFDPILGSTGGMSGGAYSLTAPFMYAQNSWFRVEIATSDSNRVYIELPAVIVTGDDYGLKGQSDVTNRGFEIRAMGGRVGGTADGIGGVTGPYYVLPPVLLSSSTGTYVIP